MQIKKEFTVESFEVSLRRKAPFKLTLKQEGIFTDDRCVLTLNADAFARGGLRPVQEILGKKLIVTLTAADRGFCDVEPRANACGVQELYEKNDARGGKSFVTRLLKVGTILRHGHLGPLPCPFYDVSVLLDEAEFQACQSQGIGTFEVDIAPAP